jgi:SET domain-containing protein
MPKNSITTQHYLSPKVEAFALPQKGGFGVRAVSFIPAGELIVFWGGDIVTTEQLDTLPLDRQIHGIQVHDNLFQVPSGDAQPGDYVNHSCEPNAGLDSPISLVAMHDILPGEEICFDYAMSDSTFYDHFECTCGTPNCRGQFTGHDWRRLDLQQRYRGYFSPYLQRRIDQLTVETAVSQPTVAHN